MEINRENSEPGAEIEASNNNPKSTYPTFVDLAAFFGVFVAAQGLGILVAKLILSYMAPQLAAPDELGWLMLLCQLFAMPLVIIFLIFLRRSRKAPAVKIMCGVKGFDPVIILGGFVMIFTASIVIEPLLALLPTPPDVEARGWPFMVSAVLLAPLFEEIICRGMIFGALRARRGTLVALVVSSLIFGIMHLQVTMSINAFVMGLILCYIYICSRSIIAPIILHILNNAVAYVAILVGLGNGFVLSDLIANQTLYIIIYVVALLLLIISTVLSARQFRRIAIKNLPTEEEYEEIFTSKDIDSQSEPQQ